MEPAAAGCLCYLSTCIVQFVTLPLAPVCLAGVPWPWCVVWPLVCRGRWQALRSLLPRLRLRSSPIPPSVTSWCGGAIVGALESLESVSVTHVSGRFVTGADGVSARAHRRPARTRVAELSGLGSRAAASSGSDTEGTSDNESGRAGTRRWVSGIGDWAQVAPEVAVELCH